MPPEQDLIRNFYAALARRDHQFMSGCYTTSASFTDPVFGTLEGGRIGAMWRMLCERAADLTLTADHIEATDSSGSAHWEARYTFSATGLPVHNVIEASFSFESGKIRRHIDRFSLYRWSRQALGLKGMLLGWSPPVQGAIRAQAARGLEHFIQKNGLGQ